MSGKYLFKIRNLKLLTLEPGIIISTLFQGDSEIDQLFRIFRVLRTPTDDIWPGVSSLPDFKATFPAWTNYSLSAQIRNEANMNDQGIQLLEKMLVYDPAKRISAKKP